jgi:hypothetical protein
MRSGRVLGSSACLGSRCELVTSCVFVLFCRDRAILPRYGLLRIHAKAPRRIGGKEKLTRFSILCDFASWRETSCFTAVTGKIKMTCGRKSGLTPRRKGEVTSSTGICGSVDHDGDSLPHPRNILQNQFFVNGYLRGVSRYRASSMANLPARRPLVSAQAICKPCPQRIIPPSPFWPTA